MKNKKSNNQILRNLIKGAIILATFVCVLFLLDKILLLKSEDGIEQMQAFYKQPKNTVDALFVGSSHIFCQVNTGILYDEYGISAYDLAGAEQPFWNSYYYIKEALKTQTPKVLVLEITTPGVRPIDYQPENWLVTNTYGINRNKNRYESIKVSALDVSFKRLLVALNTTHGRYTELTEDDFVDYNNSINNKGFDPRDTIVPFERPEVSFVTERGELSDKEEKYLRMIIEYVKSKNIPLLLMSTPYIVTPEEQAKFNTIFDIGKEYDVPFIDFNTMYDELCLDFDNDFADYLHVNRTGNEKLTKYLGAWLKDNYNLPNHQGDSAYASWEADALYQRQSYNSVKLSQAIANNDGLNFLSLAKNDNYITFVNIPENAEINEDIRFKLNELITSGNAEQGNPIENGNALIINKGNLVLTANSDTIKASVADGGRRLMLVRESDENGNIKTFVKANAMRTSNSMTKATTTDFSDSKISILIYDTVLDRIVGTMQM